MWIFLQSTNNQGNRARTLWYYPLLFSFCLCLTACSGRSPNDPHLNWHANDNVFFSSFATSPKTLDPSRAYNDDEIVFLAQVVEPPLQYSYWRKPYRLEPQSVTALPSVVYEDARHQPLPSDASPEQIAYSVYTLHFRGDLRYQPHPAFAMNPDGSFAKENLDPHRLATLSTPMQMPKLATRQVTAADYAYAIKRLASPSVSSPIYSLMAHYIVGLSALRQTLAKAYHPHQFLDLRAFPLSGVKVLDAQTLQIELKGNYPQFPYWLSMTFFVPIPWEVDKFYANPMVAKQNISFDTYPVGSGPYYIAENNPNQQIVLRKNPYYHDDFFPALPETMAPNLRALSGKRMPFIDTVVYSREAEALPRWQKFLQGYYDSAGVGGDLFNQAIRIAANGHTLLAPELYAKHMRLQVQVLPSVFYLGFNMQDPLVGGTSAKNRALRHAIGILLNSEDFNELFLNGQGIPAQGPIPIGIVGAQSGCHGMDPYRYRCVQGQPQRLTLADAKAWLVRAGYPGGIDPKTKQVLRLRFSTAMGLSPDERSTLDWLRQQFAHLGIALDVEVLQPSRFEELMRQGHAELFFWGWQADYPDPENFLMLLYSRNKMIPYGGENTCNYDNPRYDSLFKQMRLLPNNATRAQLIDTLVSISQQDAPAIWLFYPRSYRILQPWVGPVISQGIANNTLKYVSLNPSMRQTLQRAWNKPTIWPLLITLGGMILAVFMACYAYRRRQQKRPGQGS